MLSVIIPYQDSGCEFRDSNLEFTKKYLAQNLECDHELIICSHEPALYFNRSLAINNGFKQSTGEVIMVCDSDILCEKDSLQKSIQHIQNKKYKLVFPFTNIVYLNPMASSNIKYRDVPVNFNPPNKDIARQTVYAVGGSFFCEREFYKKTRGHDERFKGWGSEDVCFFYAMIKVFGERCYVRTTYSALHLYHPSSNKMDDQHKKVSIDLYNRYRDAKFKDTSKEMIELIEELEPLS